MLVTFLIITGEFVLLYFLSRRLTQNLYIAVFLLTKSRPIAISFLSILFFPGTVIHELAHLFTAEILGVRTGGLTLVPEGIEQKEVRTGSVSISQSDPIRRAVIGIAPVFVGLGALGVISYFLPGLLEQTATNATHGVLFTGYAVYLFIITIYSLFAVSNTMFSSPEDLEGFWPVVLVVILLIVAAYIAGIRINFTEPASVGITAFFRSVAINLGYITGLNVVLLSISSLLIRGVEKLTKRRLAS